MIRKKVHIAADGGSHGWARLFVQDAALLAHVAGDGDVVARLAADNRRLPVLVHQRDADGLDVTVLLPTPERGVTQAVWLEADDAGESAPATFPSFGARVDAPSVGIDSAMTVYTGEDETGSSTSTTALVHPSICRVPEGSWAKHIDGTLGGEVTHLIADTPYPSSNDDYENPVLFYSTDNCQTRVRVPSASIPWPLDSNPGSPSNKDASLFFLPESGDLVVAWLGGGFVNYAQISGTHLTDAAVDSEWSTDAADFEVSSQFAISPSYLPLSDSHVRVYFASPGPVETAGAGSIHYCETINFGSGSTVWGAPVCVAYSGGEFDKGWWHGEVVHDGRGGALSDGYWYLVFSEGLAGDIAGASVSAKLRCFRSQSLDGPWEPGLDLLMDDGSGIAPDAIYKPSLSEDASGNKFLLVSGRDGSAYAVGRAEVDLGDVDVPIATAFNQGWGSSSAYAASTDLLVGVDFQRGAVEASGNAYAVTLNGSPTEAEGTGVTCDGSTQYVQIGAAQLFAGLSFLDVELRVTFPASFTGSGNLYLLSELDWSPFDYTFRLVMNGTTGKVADYYFKNSGGTTIGDNGDIGPDLRGGTHTIRSIFDPAHGYAKLMIDGDTWNTQTGVTGVLRTVAGARLCVGAGESGQNHADCTLHYLQIRGGAGADYTAFRPPLAYSDGDRITAVSQGEEIARLAALTEAAKINRACNISSSGTLLERLKRLRRSTLTRGGV